MCASLPPSGVLEAATRDVATCLGAVLRSQATVTRVRVRHWTYTDYLNTVLALIRLFQLRQHTLTPGDPHITPQSLRAKMLLYTLRGRM